MSEKKNKLFGLIGSVSFHLLLFLLFWLIGFGHHLPKDEEGMEVMFGNTEVAAGNPVLKPVMLTQQDERVKTNTTTTTQQSSKPILTQDNEESLALQEQKRRKKEEAETRLKEEQEKARLAQEQRQKEEQQRRVNEINNKASGAFGKNGQGSGYADKGKGFQGSPTGNSTQGAVTGSGGNGNTPSFSLAGRRPVGSLPSPAYSDQVEGRIVVDIVVSPDGKVIDADIDIAKTTISASNMRKAARMAALQSRFTNLDAHDNQVGSITYVYKLRQ